MAKRFWEIYSIYSSSTSNKSRTLSWLYYIVLYLNNMLRPHAWRGVLLRDCTWMHHCVYTIGSWLFQHRIAFQWNLSVVKKTWRVVEGTEMRHILLLLYCNINHVNTPNFSPYIYIAPITCIICHNRTRSVYCVTTMR